MDPDQQWTRVPKGLSTDTPQEHTSSSPIKMTDEKAEMEKKASAYKDEQKQSMANALQASSNVGAEMEREAMAHRLQLEEEQKQHLDNAMQALSMVDDIVTKDYVTRLSDMDIVPINEVTPDEQIALFKVNKMVYEKDEYATEKFINALGAMCYADCSIFLILDGHKDKTDFYIGVQSDDHFRGNASIAKTFESALLGQFPGIDLKACDIPGIEGQLSVKAQIINKMNRAVSISSCSVVPAYKDNDGKYNNQTFVQGIEKLALAMQGKEYTAVILATNISGNSLSVIRDGYEQLYSQLSSIAGQQLAYSTNESLANAINRSKGFTDSLGIQHSISHAHTDSKNWQHSYTKGETDKSVWAKTGSVIGGALTAVCGIAVGAALMGTGIGVPLGVAVAGAGVGAGMSALGAAGKTKNKGETIAPKDENGGESNTDTENDDIVENYSENFLMGDGKTATIQSGKNITLTFENKHVQEILKRIDTQLERLSIAEGTGVWASGAYFLSYDDSSVAETGATIFRSILQGEKSGVETSAINTWINNDGENDEEQSSSLVDSNKTEDVQKNLVKTGKIISSSKQIERLTRALTNFVHPTFIYENKSLGKQVEVNAACLVSTAELAMQMGLPRKSVPGFPVLEHISLGKEIVTNSGKEIEHGLTIGCIFDQGIEHKENPVRLEKKSLTQHVFVTGSTGCGKSETVYKLLYEAKSRNVKFLIIEPAKGEYKNIFGNANVFGSNPEITDLLHINPFSFPKGVHVLEHIDRLTEIFNVCWPMYAAMPAVLKKAIIQSYEKAGWNLVKNKNKYGKIFPTFNDLLFELENVIKDSAYSEEVKGNYVGSLVTRIESLTNGLNGAIFGGEEIPDSVLFDEDTIIDLSRIGAQETKALLMGIIVMRLNEYRMVNATEANQGLKHLTVLEEAHNLLKRTSTEQSQEGSNLAGKAVEMITNSIAEMRTYGEGFVIVDQSPTSVDPAAIKNTNTKFIMRLPDGDDRRVAGKSAGLKDSQLDEIAKLPNGVAVTYQNDWEEPVLCKVSMRDVNQAKKYSYKYEDNEDFGSDYLAEVIKFLIHGKVSGKVDFNRTKILKATETSLLTTGQKIRLLELIDEFVRTGCLEIWSKDRFGELASLLTNILGIRDEVTRIADGSKSFEDFDSKLEAKVVETLGELPNPENIFIRQALLKACSLGNENMEIIYRKWHDCLEAKLVQSQA
ncbi:MAG: ATP-binding protein [Muribaculaceae bacterium]|nr:ATP-binding protein [Muribaculaceae bacterium]